MNEEVELDGIVYRCINDVWYEADTYVRAPLALAHTLDIRSHELAGAALPAKEESPPNSQPAAGPRAYDNVDVFPIIANIIRHHSGNTEAYIGHHEIVAAFLDDAEGKSLAEAAAAQQEKTAQRVGSSLVSWFSRRFTAGNTPYQSEFERERISGVWAYRVAMWEQGS